MTVEDARRCAVLIAVQQALLGEVTPNLRAFAIRYEDASIQLEAFFDQQPAEDEVEAMARVETEVIALFPESHRISLQLVTSPSPQPIPKDRIWTYHRKEELVD